MSGYNGWKNYETWLTNLWYGDYLSEYYLELFREGELTNPVEAENVKDIIESLIFDCGVGVDGGYVPESGFIADLVNGAMSEVDWREIASHVEDLIKYEMENA